MTKILEFLADKFLIFAIVCGVILVALAGLLIISGISAKKKKQAENTEATTTDSATDMSLPEGTEVAAPVDFGTTPEVAPAPVAEPSLDGLNANVGGDVVAPAAEPASSEPTLVIEDTAAPAAMPEVTPTPVVTPEVAPAPVVTPEVAPAPAVTPEVAPAPVVTPEVAPAPAVTPEVAPAPVVTPEVAPAPAAAPEVAPAPVVTPEVAPAPAAPTETGSIFDTPNNN